MQFKDALKERAQIGQTVNNNNRYFPLSALISCKCSTYRDRPLPPDHAAHVFHQLQCAKFYLTTTRHDALLAILGAALKQLCFDVSFSKRENSSSDPP